VTTQKRCFSEKFFCFRRLFVQTVFLGFITRDTKTLFLEKFFRFRRYFGNVSIFRRIFGNAWTKFGNGGQPYGE
jgi:hypothetical protein